MLALSVSLPSFSASPCKSIAAACKKEGYYKGGDKKGKGLIKDCVMPVAAGEKTLPNTTFSADVMQQCKATVEHQMKGRM